MTTSAPAANAATSTADLSEDVVTETTTIMSTATMPATMTSAEVLTSTAPDGQLITYTSVITVTGQTTVVTAIATVDPSGGNSLNNAAKTGESGFFNNTGAVAGTFVAVGLAALALLAGGLWFARRRRRQRALDEDLRVAAGGAGDGGAGTSRFHDDEDDDFEASTNAHGSYGSPQMTQYSPFSLPSGAAAAPSSGSQPYYGGQGASTESGGASNYLPAMAAGGAAAAGTAAAGGYASHGGYSPYGHGPNQAYNDQYAVAQQYTDNPYGDWHEVSQPMMNQDGSGEGSAGESDPSNRRDSRWVGAKC